MSVEHELARLVAVAALVVLHLSAGAMRFLDGVPRSRWLSAAGGISVAYVFVHLLPELAEGQRAVASGAAGALPFLEDQVYLLALLGFGVFYGVEVLARRSHGDGEAGSGDDRAGGEAFAFSILSFAIYNGIIGYLVAREEFDLQSLILFSVGIGLHFVVNDFSLREHHAAAYDRLGRFVVAAGILAGWGIGQLTEISEAAIGLLLAFIGGGVILNVIKEELPKERRSRFSAFALAAVAYAALLVAV